VLVAGRGAEPPAPGPPRAQTAPAPREPGPPPPLGSDRLATGLAEQNPGLFAPAVPERFAAWRDRTVALRPRVFRLLVDWARLQPSADRPPDLAAPNAGCLRDVEPCAPYAGVRDQLRALRDRGRADGGWEVLVSPYNAPDWALAPRAGCPAGGRIDLAAYRRLLRDLAALGAAEDVRLRWWSPWNEPNHPAFLAPQRTACDAGARALSPRAYARLVRAARTVLPEGAELVVGEAAGYDRPRRDRLGAAELASSLPRDVVCAGRVWAQHTYVGRSRRPEPDGGDDLDADRALAGNSALVRAVSRALDARGCPQEHRIWITETGATPGPGACPAMAAALEAWDRDPRVDVAVQYTFREDPLFRVGLADAALTTERGAYAAWRAWASAERVAGSPCPT
jgi:hypothetical protein